jgi:hypothetical protein
MRTTTDSQIAETSYSDYLRETTPTLEKSNVAWMANMYINHFGLPFSMSPTTPAKIAKIVSVVLFGHSRWMSNQIKEAWDLA